MCHVKSFLRKSGCFKEDNFFKIPLLFFSNKYGIPGNKCIKCLLSYNNSCDVVHRRFKNTCPQIELFPKHLRFN